MIYKELEGVKNMHRMRTTRRQEYKICKVQHSAQQLTEKAIFTLF